MRKSSLIKLYAKRIASKVSYDAKNGLQDQEKILKLLLKKASQTHFGKEHNFSKITSPNQYSAAIPIRTYEELSHIFKKS